jgi:hypothetical protein
MDVPFESTRLNLREPVAAEVDVEATVVTEAEVVRSWFWFFIVYFQYPHVLTLSILL